MTQQLHAEHDPPNDPLQPWPVGDPSYVAKSLEQDATEWVHHYRKIMGMAIGKDLGLEDTAIFKWKTALAGGMDDSRTITNTAAKWRAAGNALHQFNAEARRKGYSVAELQATYSRCY